MAGRRPRRYRQWDARDARRTPEGVAMSGTASYGRLAAGAVEEASSNER